MQAAPKSTLDEITRRFDAEVERFSNLDSGQISTVDAALCMELVAQAAAAATPHAITALDIGCGAGNYSLKLREELPALRVTLVDLSQPMLDRAALRLGAAVAETRRGDIRAMDFPEAAFDVVVAAAVFHHLRQPAEWERMFRRLHAWLRPRGSVWIFDLVAHESGAIQGAMWARYGAYLTRVGGDAYREKVFRYIAEEDSPVPLTYQLELLRTSGFAAVDVLHKNACFAAFGATKAG
jgi:tRNA (cmo5U34)-methyltransferase